MQALSQLSYGPFTVKDTVSSDHAPASLGRLAGETQNTVLGRSQVSSSPPTSPMMSVTSSSPSSSSGMKVESSSSSPSMVSSISYAVFCLKKKKINFPASTVGNAEIIRTNDNSYPRRDMARASS